MRIWTKTFYKWDDAAQQYVVDEAISTSIEYDGPVAELKKDSAAPTPDPAIGQAAKDSIALGKDWLSFAKDQFAVASDRQANLDQITGDVVSQQLADTKLASERSTQQFDRYTNLFQPAEDRMVQDAMGYDTPERQAQAAAEAKADVLRNADQAKQRGTREMAAMGIDPTSGRHAGITRAGDIDTALGAAQAENNARKQVETTGMALREGVANFGRGATATSAQQASIAQGGGNSAVGNQGAAEGNFRANTGIMQSGFQGGIGAYGQGAGIMQNQYQSELSSWAANQQAKAANTAGIASALGTGIGAYAALSSKDYKENKQPIKEGAAMEAINAMPVESWKYKEGIGDSGNHIGPYAEDFHAATGKGDGKSIPLQDMMGLTVKAVQELSKKVDKMQAQGA